MILLNEKQVEVKYFPNGEINLDESLVELIDEENIVQHLALRFEMNEDLVILTFVSEWLKEEGYDKQELHISYLPYSRMDRKVNHHLFSLKYVAKMINVLNFEKVYILEHHSDVSIELIENAVPISYTKTLIEKAMTDISFNKETDIIIFPDMGAQKRYKNLLNDDIRLFVGFKKRDFDTGKIIGLELEGDDKPVGKALIVDDLCSRGGTFIQIANECTKLDIHDVSLVVTHLESNVYNGQIFDYVKNVYTTNALEPFLKEAVNNTKIKIEKLPVHFKMTV